MKGTEYDKSSVPTQKSRYVGCLLGGAVGDALGYPVEFMSEEQIFSVYWPGGICRLEDAGDLARISDDTQMSLFAANADIYRRSNLSAMSHKRTMSAAWCAYREWLGTQTDTSRLDPDGTKMWIYGDQRLHEWRAPGNTCLKSIRYSEYGGTMEEPINNSKGCGTVMRAAPYGLMIREDPGEMDRYYGMDVAARDAALTHGHPYAWAASAWMAGCICELVQAGRPWSGYLSDWKVSEKYRLEEIMLERVDLAKELDSDGTIRNLVKMAVDLAGQKEVSDLEGIHRLGEGWVAEEALAIAVFCAVRYQDDFGAGVRAAVNHKGDSDSTGAICGNILGAWLGKEGVEEAFRLEELELRDVIETIAEDLYRSVWDRIPEPGEDPLWDKRYRTAGI